MLSKPLEIIPELRAKEKLLEVARKLFAEQGLEGTSTRDIAASAGLNISMISYYFGGKEGLYKAVIADFAMHSRRLSDAWLATLELEKMTKPVFLDSTKEMIRLLVSVKFGAPEMEMILRREMISGLPYARDIFEEVFTGIVLQISEIFKQAQDKGIIRKNVNPHLLFVSMVHTVEGYFLMSCCNTLLTNHLYKMPQDTEKYVQQIHSIFIEGVTI